MVDSITVIKSGGTASQLRDDHTFHMRVADYGDEFSNKIYKPVFLPALIRLPSPLSPSPIPSSDDIVQTLVLGGSCCFCC